MVIVDFKFTSPFHPNHSSTNISKSARADPLPVVISYLSRDIPVESERGESPACEAGSLET